MKVKKIFLLSLLRISMGFIFLWSFFDKLIGLGFDTKRESSWLLNTSPTYGFLKLGVHGPFAQFYNNLAGSAIVDWLFMIGLLLIGICLIAGIGKKIACYSGSLMMLLMWTALIPPKYNPLIDEHIIYIIVLLVLNALNAGQNYGFGKQWRNTKAVRKYSILE